MNGERADTSNIDLTDCTDEQIIEFVDSLNARGSAVTLNIPATGEGIAYFFRDVFRCRHCGRCCDGSLKDAEADGIGIDGPEMDDIASYLETDRKELAERWTSDGDGGMVLRYPCAFRSPETGRCDIYPVRPLVCRYYPLEHPATIGSGDSMRRVLTVDTDCPSARDVAIRCLTEIRHST